MDGRLDVDCASGPTSRLDDLTAFDDTSDRAYNIGDGNLFGPPMTEAGDLLELGLARLLDKVAGPRLFGVGSPDGGLWKPDVQDIVAGLKAVIDERLNEARGLASTAPEAPASAAPVVFGVWCMPKTLGTSHDNHPGWSGEDTAGRDPSLYASREMAAYDAENQSTDRWSYEVRPYATVPCLLCKAEGDADAALAASPGPGPSSLPSAEIRAKLARLAEIEDDRTRALRRAYDLTPDAQTLDEAVAAIVTWSLGLRTERDEAVQKHKAIAADERALREEILALRAKLQIVQAGPEDVWFWQNVGNDPGSLSCPVVMSADTLRRLLDRAAG